VRGDGDRDRHAQEQTHGHRGASPRLTHYHRANIDTLHRLQRLTIDEAAAICERQELELVEIGQQTKQCEDAMRALKPRIKASKMSIERYSQTAKQLRREQDERDAKGVQDVRAEEGCEWCVPAGDLPFLLLVC